MSDADPQLLYESDHELRKSLNKRLIRELLTDLFTRYHGEKAAYDTGMSVNLMRDLISIHPFENYNGRISREYFLSTNLQMNREVPTHMLADFDLLKSVDFYRKLLISTEEHYQEFRKGMLVELLNSRMERRSPSYESIPELNKLLKSFKVMGIDEDLPLDHDDLELIRQRKFTEYFDKNLNENWRFSDFTGVVNVFSSFKDENFKREYLNNLIDSDIINDENTEDIKKILDGIDNIDELYEFSKLIERTDKVRIKELCRSYFVNTISEESTLKAKHKKFLKQIIIENDQYKVSLTAKAYSFLLNYFTSKNSLNIPKDKVLVFVKNISEQTGWHTRRDVAKELSDIRDNDYALSFLKIFSNDSDGDVRSATFKSLERFIKNSDDAFIINYVDSLLTQDGFDQTDANIIFHALTEDKITVENPKYGDFILENKDLFNWTKRRDLARMFTQKTNDLNTIRILKIFSNDSDGDVRAASFKSLENFIANSDDAFIINYVDSLLTQDGFDQTDANIIFYALTEDKISVENPKYGDFILEHKDLFSWNKRRDLARMFTQKSNDLNTIKILKIFSNDSDGDVRATSFKSLENFIANSDDAFIINYVDSLLTQDGFDQTDANIIFYALTEDKISVKNPKYGDFILEHKDLFSWNKRRDLARMFTQQSNDLNTINILKIFSTDSDGDVRSATFKSLENFIANSDDEFIINYVDSLLTQDGFDQTDANIIFHAIMQDKVAITKVKYSKAVKDNIDSFPWTRRKELALKLGKYKDNKSVINLLHILTSDKDGDVRRTAIESIKENYNNSKPSFQNSCSDAIKALMAN